MSARSVFDKTIVISFLCLASVVKTATAHAESAAPLGQEIGVAALADVQAKLGKMTALKDAGINKFTGGRMLAGDGAGLGVDGLSEITFVFDKGDILQGVIMTLPKRFKPTFEMLRKKYTLVSKQIPFVGDTNARFSQGRSVIRLDAPHLSFEMTLSYLSESLLAAFQNRTARDREQHDKEQEQRL